MGSLLKYRGLPGGPTEVKFADELPRHCLCGQCGMITLSMYQDPNDHMFCDTCLHERSTKYGKFEIYCAYERKNIGINEMFEARDLVTILRDQFVDCPNKPHCKEKFPLENLHDHYVACKRSVQCSNCGESVETKKWEDHRCALQTERAVTKAIEKTGASKKSVKCTEGQVKQKLLVLRSAESSDIEPSSNQRCGGRQTTAKSMSPAETLRRAVAFPQPDQRVAPEERGAAAPMQNSDGGNHGPEAVQACKYCHRNVKDVNVELHQKKCTKAPKPCVYCDKPFLPNHMQLHLQKCTQNPDNVPECNSAAPAPGAVTDPPETNRSDETGFDTNRDTNIGDGPIWHQNLALGNWLGAFVAMEESFRDSVLEQQDRYARFAPALVSLQLYDCVRDFLAQPCPVQPYDCLLAALLVRKYLPRNVWSRRQEVTWADALQYMPCFLASRLSEEAIAYLCAFPVFLNEIGSHEVHENAACAAPCQPSLKPGPNGVSEQSSSGEAHGTVKTTKTDTPKRDLEEEAPTPAESGKQHSTPLESESTWMSSSLLSRFLDYWSNPAPIGTLFQEDEDKASANLKTDESATNDADRTVYLDAPPESSSLRTRSSSDSITNACTMSKRERLLSAIAGSPRRSRGLLPNASESGALQDYQGNEYPTPVNSSTRDSYWQAQESDDTLIAMSGATSPTELASSDSGTDLSNPKHASRDEPNGGTGECPMTCREFAASQDVDGSIYGASYAEYEFYKRRNRLRKPAPYELRSPVTATHQYLHAELRYASSAMVSMRHPSRARVAASPEHSSALNGCPSSRLPERGLGRGQRTLGGEIPRYPGALPGDSPGAMSAHVAHEASFQNT